MNLFGLGNIGLGTTVTMRDDDNQPQEYEVIGLAQNADGSQMVYIRIAESKNTTEESEA